MPKFAEDWPVVYVCGWLKSENMPGVSNAIASCRDSQLSLYATEFKVLNVPENRKRPLEPEGPRPEPGDGDKQPDY